MVVLGYVQNLAAQLINPEQQGMTLAQQHLYESRLDVSNLNSIANNSLGLGSHTCTREATPTKEDSFSEAVIWNKKIVYRSFQSHWFADWLFLHYNETRTRYFVTLA